MKQNRDNGFTLIELLVALAILGVIVVMCGRLFEQSNIAWKTGTRKAEMNMVGRGLADFMAQDIARAVIRENTDQLAKSVSFNNSSFKFWILDEAGVSADETEALLEIEYKVDGNIMKRNDVQLAPEGMVSYLVEPRPSAAGMPNYVDVTITVKEDEVGSTFSLPFKSRAWLVNWNRYKYDE